MMKCHKKKQANWIIKKKNQIKQYVTLHESNAMLKKDSINL